MFVANMAGQILAADRLATAEICVNQRRCPSEVRHTTLGIVDADVAGAHEDSDEFCI